MVIGILGKLKKNGFIILLFFSGSLFVNFFHGKGLESSWETVGIYDVNVIFPESVNVEEFFTINVTVSLIGLNSSHPYFNNVSVFNMIASEQLSYIELVIPTIGFYAGNKIDHYYLVAEFSPNNDTDDFWDGFVSWHQNSTYFLYSFVVFLPYFDGESLPFSIILTFVELGIFGFGVESFEIFLTKSFTLKINTKESLSSSSTISENKIEEKTDLIMASSFILLFITLILIKKKKQ